MKKLKDKLDQIDHVEEKLKKASETFAKFDNRISDVERKPTENSAAVSAISLRVEKLEDQGLNCDHERDLKRHEKTIESLCKSLDSMRRDY